MRRLVQTPRFQRSLRKFVERQTQLQHQVGETLHLMERDIFAPCLGTHKLRGELFGLRACSCGYDCRIIFSLEKDLRTNEEFIVLHDIGTHSAVY